MQQEDTAQTVLQALEASPVRLQGSLGADHVSLGLQPPDTDGRFGGVAVVTGPEGRVLRVGTLRGRIGPDHACRVRLGLGDEDLRLQGACTAAIWSGQFQGRTRHPFDLVRLIYSKDPQPVFGAFWLQPGS